MKGNKTRRTLSEVVKINAVRNNTNASDIPIGSPELPKPKHRLSMSLNLGIPEEQANSISDIRALDEFQSNLITQDEALLLTSPIALVEPKDTSICPSHGLDIPNYWMPSQSTNQENVDNVPRLSTSIASTTSQAKPKRPINRITNVSNLSTTNISDVQNLADSYQVSYRKSPILALLSSNTMDSDSEGSDAYDENDLEAQILLYHIQELESVYGRGLVISTNSSVKDVPAMIRKELIDVQASIVKYPKHATAYRKWEDKFKKYLSDLQIEDPTVSLCLDSLVTVSTKECFPDVPRGFRTIGNQPCFSERRALEKRAQSSRDRDRYTRNDRVQQKPEVVRSLTVPAQRFGVSLSESLEEKKRVKNIQIEIDALNKVIFDIAEDESQVNRYNKLQTRARFLKCLQVDSIAVEDVVAEEAEDIDFVEMNKLDQISHDVTSPLQTNDPTHPNILADSVAEVCSSVVTNPFTRIRVQHLTELVQIFPDFVNSEDNTLDYDKLVQLWDWDGLDQIVSTQSSWILSILGARFHVTSSTTRTVVDGKIYPKCRNFLNWMQVAYGDYNVFVETMNEDHENRIKLHLVRAMAASKTPFNRTLCRGFLAMSSVPVNTNTFLKALKAFGIQTVRVVGFGQKMNIHDNPVFFASLNRATDRAQNFLGDSYDTDNFHDVGLHVPSDKLQLLKDFIKPRANHDAPYLVATFPQYPHLSTDHRAFAYGARVTYNANSEQCNEFLAENFTTTKIYNPLMHISKNATGSELRNRAVTHDQILARQNGIGNVIRNVEDILFDSMDTGTVDGPINDSTETDITVKGLGTINFERAKCIGGFRIEHKVIRRREMSHEVMKQLVSEALKYDLDLHSPFFITDLIQPFVNQGDNRVIVETPVVDWYECTKHMLETSKLIEPGTGRNNSEGSIDDQRIAGDLTAAVGLNYTHYQTPVNGINRRWWNPTLIQESVEPDTERDFSFGNLYPTTEEWRAIFDVGDNENSGTKWPPLHKRFMAEFGWPDNDPEWQRKDKAHASLFFHTRLSTWYKNNKHRKQELCRYTEDLSSPSSNNHTDQKKTPTTSSRRVTPASNKRNPKQSTSSKPKKKRKSVPEIDDSDSEYETNEDY